MISIWAEMRKLCMMDQVQLILKNIAPSTESLIEVVCYSY